MTAAVTGLGYAIVEASDIPAWRAFACDLLGMQAVVDTTDRLLLRIDEKAYRLDVRRGPADAVKIRGWEVKGPNELDELATSLEGAGFAVKRGDAELAKERMVGGLAQFEDPAGNTLELFYALRRDRERFVSPNGARFVTGTGGMGHAMQIVSDGAAFEKLYLDILGFSLSDYIYLNPDLFATFTHVNQRHHSFAFAPIPQAPQGIAHLMVEVDDIDDVGRAWDKVLAGAAPIASTFGKHTNDEMLSFYVHTPSGFQIEFGTGGKLIDDNTWTADSYVATSYWGHKKQDPNEPDV